MAQQFNDNDPRKKGQPDEIINQEEETVVNTDEQNEVVNEQDSGNTPGKASDDKQKGYEEGIHNDSLTEPEVKDSDGQPVFPDEEGNN